MLLDAERTTDVATAFLEGLDVDRDFDGLTGFIVFFWCILVDKITSAAVILNCVRDNLCRTTMFLRVRSMTYPNTYKPDSSLTFGSGIGGAGGVA